MDVHFISSRDTGETLIYYAWSNNVSIMQGTDTYDIIREIFKSFLHNYQQELKIIKGSDFVFESVDLLDYKLHRVRLKRVGSDKYIDTSEFNKLAVDIFNARLAQANLVTKTDFDAKLLGLNRKITQNKTKRLLVENELNKLKTFDSGYFIGKSHFEEDSSQNYLVFQPLFRYFKLNLKTGGTILSWKSKRLSDETIEQPSTSNIGPIPDLYAGKFRVKCIGRYLKQANVSCTHRK